MADTTTKRKHLNDYSHAHRQIELVGVAITVLGGVGTPAAEKAIKLLLAGQHRLVDRLDAAAAKLGAPYPTGGTPHG